MLLSLQEQEQQYRAAQVYGQDDPARSSTQSASPSGVRSHQNASPRPYRPPPAPPRPTLFPAGSQQTNSPASHEQHPPFTRRQPHPSSSGTSYDVEGVLPQDAPPAYEASSSMSVSHPSSTTSSATDPSLMSPYTHPSTAGNSQQPLSPQEEAARLEEKRLVYYPPIADNEMAEGVSDSLPCEYVPRIPLLLRLICDTYTSPCALSSPTCSLLLEPGVPWKTRYLR